MRSFKVFFLALFLGTAPAALAQVHFVVPGIRVGIPPPALRVEVRPMAPSPNHLWIDGYWAWRGGRHVWLGGHYALPPGPGYVWEPARWVNENGQWTFFDGHWRLAVAPPPAEVYQPVPGDVEYAAEAPPQPIVEVQPPLPFGGAVWIPGYWRWHGAHYVWVGGRWSAGQPGRVWEPHRWVAVNGRWRMEPGSWR
jgi:hypothetical protein